MAMDPIFIKQDESDYDQLHDEDEFDEEEEEDPTKFVIREPLQPPVTRTLSTKQLHAMIHESLIDVDPPYQRGTVWPQSKQIHLIDSIFRNYFVPPLVFAIQVNEFGDEVRQCVDGKQRLTSILKFLDGHIPHQDPKTRKNFWTKAPKTQKATKLRVPKEWLAQFEQKQITCVEYRDISGETERDIFQRVQLGVSLTAAEKLQAISSPYSDWIHDLVGRFISNKGGIAELLSWDTKRGRDYQCLAQIVYCCGNWSQKPFPTTDNMKKFIDTTDAPSNEFKDDLVRAMTEFRLIASSDDLNYGFKKIDRRLAPIEFVFVGVLLYLLKSSTHVRRAWLIHEMRTHTRKKFRDIRANTTVMKVFWDFIGALPEMDDDVETAGQNKRRMDDDGQAASGHSKKRGKVARTE